MATYYAKNKTGSALPITDVGITIPASSSLEIQPSDYLKWAYSAEAGNAYTLINAGSLIVNDGSNDLNVALSIFYLRRAIALYLGFDNRTNSFTATNVQEAIEEAKGSAQGTGPYCVSCGFDGNASSGRYLEYQSNVDSNVVGFIVPKASVLTNMSLGVSANSTTTFKVYKWDGTTETEIASISLSGVRKGKVDDLAVSLVALDEVRVKCTSGSCSRPIMFQLLRFI